MAIGKANKKQVAIRRKLLAAKTLRTDLCKGNIPLLKKVLLKQFHAKQAKLMKLRLQRRNRVKELRYERLRRRELKRKFTSLFGLMKQLEACKIKPSKVLLKNLDSTYEKGRQWLEDQENKRNNVEASSA